MDGNKPAIETQLPYATEEEYLTDQLARVDLLIKLALDKKELAEYAPASPELSGLVLTKDEIDQYLGNTDESDKSDKQRHRESMRDTIGRIAEIEQRIKLRIEHSWQNQSPPSLEWIAENYLLTAFEKDILILLLAPELHRKYERLYAYLQDDVTRRYASVNLILQLLCASFEENLTGRVFLSSDSLLVRHGIVRFVGDAGEDGNTQISRAIRLEDRIVNFVLHRQAFNPELDASIKLLGPGHPIAELLLGDDGKQRLSNLVDHYSRVMDEFRATRMSDAPNLTCYLRGRRGVGKRQAAAAVCRELGINLLLVDVPELLAREPYSDALVQKIAMEARLNRAALFFQPGDEASPADPAERNRPFNLEVLLSRLSGLKFVASELDESASLDATDSRIAIDLPTQDFALRKQAWRRALDRYTVDPERFDLDDLATQFDFTVGQINSAVRQYADHTAIELNGSEASARDLLYRACRQQGTRKLALLAQKITPVYSWQDIVLSGERTQQLREICEQVRLSPRVLGDWGFGVKLQRGSGINALFSGPTGTGKTMAAEIIAGDLGLDLYKIDLSSIVSKYIGETEKNLSHLFNEAESSNAILFFDEADALFGKRTEVKDSHDRYANIEVNYLLQRIEEYSGIVILATNLRGHLDDAFTRRLRITVEFPLPDEDSRTHIWKKVFPQNAPLDKSLDIAFVASRFKLSGGNIRNAALASAFLAARENQPITMRHLVYAIKTRISENGPDLYQKRIWPVLQVDRKRESRMRRRKRKLDPVKMKSEPLRPTQGKLSSRQYRERIMNAREREKRSAGYSLDSDIRQKMERLLNQDFGNVVIHSNSNANRAAELRQAKAYVRGRDIYFGRAQYDPGSEQGLTLLAHELVHVAQTDGKTPGRSEEASRVDQQIEKQATAATSGVLQGQNMAVTRQTNSTGVLRETTEDAETPTVSVHPYDITAAHSSGVINAGSFSVSFRYLVSEGSGETILVLEIPEAVSAVFAPLNDVPRGAYRIDDPGGDAARTVKIHMQSETGGIPAIQATFSNGSNHHMTIFKFPG